MNSNRSPSNSFSSESSGFSPDFNHNYDDIEGNKCLISFPASQYKKVEIGHNSRLRCDQIIGVISLVVSVVCLICVVGLVCWVFLFGGARMLLEFDGVGKYEQVCLPCIQINPSPLENKPSTLLNVLDKRFDQDNDTQICCARNAAQYAALFKLILKRQEEVKKLADFLGRSSSDAHSNQTAVPHSSFSTVSAHLLFQSVPHEPANSSTDVIQQWKSPEQTPLSHVQNGLKLHNNRIFVQTPGLYFIYSQVLFNRGEENNDQQQAPLVISNYVKRDSLPYTASSGILLKGRHTRHDLRMDRHSTYVAGLFYLHTGDSIFVQVSHPALISHDETGTFFGLFRMSS